MKENRYFCWDLSEVDEHEGITLIAHKPQKRNIALVCDAEWEGVHNGYGSLLRVGDVYRLYYRADASRCLTDGTLSPAKAVVCVAESRDGGITFRKPILGKHAYGGTRATNIVFEREGSIDNFSVFYDENPDCPEEARFKALSAWMDEKRGRHLCCYVSADGYDFTRAADIPVKGTFDSFNVLLWDEVRRLYFVYYRSYHRADGSEEPDDNFMSVDVVHDVRDIRVATSPDFLHWTEHGRITFSAGEKDIGLYTNQIMKYPRASDLFIGFPVRYRDRAGEKRNFDHMPLGDLHQKMTAAFGRGGTALTDTVIMTSYDGRLFHRRDEAFLTPGPEARDNWWYGDCYTVYGMIRTPAEEEGAQDELSFYVGEGYRVKSVNFRRYTLRLDGFYSFYAMAQGGSFLTRPIRVTGDTLTVNFATSAIGGMKVALCDEAGAPIAGYESYEMFGDAVARTVEFEKPLSALAGREVRLSVTLADAHLYSFAFSS